MALATALNSAFILLQMLILSIYFSLKNGKWVNVTKELLGWGDVLFLLSLAFYLSALNFLFFYLASLIAVLICWISWQAFSKGKSKQIPLAGLQALFFLIFLGGDWWYKPIGLTSDFWLLNLITK
jgi:hypothetical protein